MWFYLSSIIFLLWGSKEIIDILAQKAKQTPIPRADQN